MRPVTERSQNKSCWKRGRNESVSGSLFLDNSRLLSQGGSLLSSWASMKRVRRGPVPVFGSDFTGSDIRRVKKTLRAQWVGMGPEVEKFEALLSRRSQSEHAIATNSASAALKLALSALRLPAKSEVVLPSNTWNTCANAILLNNLTPVFADIDPNSGNTNAELVSRVMTPLTRAVLVVHYAGLSVEFDPLNELSVPVVEDAAHAVDATYRGRPCGSLGSLGVFSFDPVKNIATPDLGVIVTGDYALAKRIKDARYAGIASSGASASGEHHEWWIPRQLSVEQKLLPNDLAASLALSQFRRISKSQATRKKIWETYDEGFRDQMKVRTPPAAREGDRHGYFTYFVRVPRHLRDELARFLLSRGIYTTVRYAPLHSQSLFRDYVTQGSELSGAEEFGATALNLPLYPGLRKKEQSRIIHLINAFLDSRT